MKNYLRKTGRKRDPKQKPRLALMSAQKLLLYKPLLE